MNTNSCHLIKIEFSGLGFHFSASPRRHLTICLQLWVYLIANSPSVISSIFAGTSSGSKADATKARNRVEHVLIRFARCQFPFGSYQIPDTKCKMQDARSRNNIWQKSLQNRWFVIAKAYMYIVWICFMLTSTMPTKVNKCYREKVAKWVFGFGFSFSFFWEIFIIRVASEPLLAA